MLLQDKVAVIYGAGGAVGGTVARTFTKEGARVFLAGRTAASVEQVADDIRAGGGVAEAAVVDALDPHDVDAPGNADRVDRQDRRQPERDKRPRGPSRHAAA